MGLAPLVRAYTGTVLVGREDERRTLERLLAGARVGSIGVLVITGEAGNGKSALLALLDAGGALRRGDELAHESIVGTVFSARVVGDAEVSGRSAVVTQVEGSAHRTGEHEFVLDERDELGTGFLLR